MGFLGSVCMFSAFLQIGERLSALIMSDLAPWCMHRDNAVSKPLVTLRASVKSKQSMVMGESDRQEKGHDTYILPSVTLTRRLCNPISFRPTCSLQPFRISRTTRVSKTGARAASSRNVRMSCAGTSGGRRRRVSRVSRRGL